MTSAQRAAGDRGQAAVELVAMLPTFAAIALAAAQLLAAGVARELARHAAQAGAMAMLQGGDPTSAARAAVPSWSRATATVKIDGRTVRVALRPPGVFPALSSLLTAHGRASAGT